MIAPTRREVRLAELLECVGTWRSKTGADRTYWRSRSLSAIADFRHFHLDPEAAAYAAALARTRTTQRKAA